MGKKINQRLFEFGRMVVTINRNRKVGKGSQFLREQDEFCLDILNLKRTNDKNRI